MATAINNTPATITTKGIQKLCQLIKSLVDTNKNTSENQMAAIAEALNDLNARITGLESSESLPDLIANSINVQEIPKVGSCSMILNGISAPSTAPDFVGQVYINISDSKIYVAKAISAGTDWIDVTQLTSISDCVRTVTQTFNTAQQIQALANLGTKKVHTLTKNQNNYLIEYKSSPEHIVTVAEFHQWIKNGDFVQYADIIEDSDKEIITKINYYFIYEIFYEEEDEQGSEVFITYDIEFICLDSAVANVKKYICNMATVDSVDCFSVVDSASQLALVNAHNRGEQPSVPITIGEIFIGSTGRVFISVGPGINDWKEIQFVS